MFGAMTSLTGGGGLNSSSSASVGGDTRFDGNDFNYRTKSQANANQTVMLVGLFAIVGVVVIAKAVK